MVGAGILAATFVAWLLNVELGRFSWTMATILWISPLAAGCVVSFLSPSRKVVLGSSMAIAAALLATVLNWSVQLLGMGVDFPGLKGGITLLLLVLAGAIPLSLIGAIAGRLMSLKGR